MYWNRDKSVYPDDITGLTLTWDVLKFCSWNLRCSDLLRLTLTWDVLKYVQGGLLEESGAD